MSRESKAVFPFPRTAIAAALALMSVPALAQELVLEEVIVTAQKRVENVQDIAATVNVLSGQDIDRFAAFDFTSIQQQTAGLTLAQPNARNNTISMRGISIDPEAGVAAAVDVFWNDANVRADIVFNQMYDLERIEVLRGPQGTLQGRTSPAGAINMITRRAPLDESSGYVQGSVSDNDGYNGQLAYGAALIPGTFGVRVAGVYDSNNGTNVNNITTGFDDQEAEAYSGRLSTIWQPMETLQTQLIYQYLDRSTDDPKAMSGADVLGGRPTLEPDDRKALGNSNDFGDLDFNLANLNTDWEVLNHQVTAIIAYQESTKTAQTENDRAYSLQYANTQAPSFQDTQTKTDSISYELRAASMDNDFWNYMVGLYYQDQNTKTKFNSNGVRLDVSGLGFLTSGVLPVNSNNFAVFTFNTLDLTDTLQLELGLRWTKYEQFRRADVYFGGLTWVPPGLEPFKDIIEAGFAANFPIEAVPADKDSDNEDAVTGSVALRWDWRDDTNLYASYNRGYRPSGISIIPSPDVQFLPNGVDDLLYDEETSDAFEIGSKSRLWEGRATLNTALYYQTFDGYLGFVRGVQVLNDLGQPVDLPGGIVFNGDANIWGVEIESQVLLTETWNAGGAMSYSKGEWDGASQPCNERSPGEVLGSCDIDGEPLGGEPEWSFSLNSEYYYPIGDTEVYVRGLFKYTDDRINTEASAGTYNVDTDFESYQILDLFVGWRSSSYQWDLSVWAKNVTDEDAVVFQQGPDQYDIAISDGSYTQTNTLRERVFGMTARYNF
ncbi:MAG: TonB-dependent receptor [Halieaceae bacterium]|jgi:outer membrane receptor protein involved in Fe transport|nr:TonB-dependent receptor [Halieaceae bacterium]